MFSKKDVTRGETGNSSGAVRMAATPRGNGYADNFYSNVGETFNYGSESVGNEPNHMVNP